VLFILSELGVWKTELLYQAMLKHPRFEPIIGVVTSTELPSAKEDLKIYLTNHGYNYLELDNIDSKFPIHVVNPDIVFYQKPYMGCYAEQYHFRNNLKPIYYSVTYAFYNILMDWSFQPLNRICIHNLLENNSVCEDYIALHGKKSYNSVVTGIPMQDELNIPKESYDDPWKSSQHKKRIIYAPHHSLPCLHGMEYATFLENGEFMLEMMEKYKDKVQWSFKPHPLLYKRLLLVWGRERTDAYYKRWAEAENAQFENGKYIALFKYSDAMIHDCGSFTIEYHYTLNPVMYLLHGNNDHHTDNMARYAVQAFDLHYKGTNHQAIEQFIVNVINGVDPLRPQREKFYKECLIPPYGKSASENIINCILGEAEFKNL
jgi:hypothetical protein